jgi:hypothetical protein
MYIVHVGVFSYPNGNRYDGDFLDDLKHGHGVLTYSNGEKYEVSFHVYTYVHMSLHVCISLCIYMSVISVYDHIYRGNGRTVSPMV